MSLILNKPTIEFTNINKVIGDTMIHNIKVAEISGINEYNVEYTAKGLVENDKIVDIDKESIMFLCLSCNDDTYLDETADPEEELCDECFKSELR